MPRTKRQSTGAASSAEPQHARKKRRVMDTSSEPRDTRKTRRTPKPPDARPSAPLQADPTTQADTTHDVEPSIPATTIQAITAAAAESATKAVLEKLGEMGLLRQPTDGNTAPNNTPPVPADDNTELAAQTVQALLYGENTPGECDLTPTCTQPPELMSTPLGYHVDAKQRAKIWSDQYVDYKHLLPGNHAQQYSVKVGPDNGGSQSLRLYTQQDTRPISNIDTWCTAHNIYTYIYLQKHPNAAPALIKYSEIVRDLAKRFGSQAFSYYDENFRSLRQANPNLRFDTPHHELWIKATTHKPLASINSPQPFRNNKFSNQQTPSSQGGIPKGYCFNYNKPGTFCKVANCQFRHSCPDCNQQHPKFKCTQNKPMSSANPQSAASNASRST